jgi:hypothetical protein
MGTNEPAERVVRTWGENSAGTGSGERYDTASGKTFRQAEPFEQTRYEKCGDTIYRKPY